MKKQQKPKQEIKPKKKEIIKFQQRFKDKKNVVPRSGILDLLGLQQPFDLNREIMPHDYQPIVEVVEQIKNPEDNKQKKAKRRMSQADVIKSNKNDTKLRTNKTNKTDVKKGIKKQQKREKIGLPRISKSSANILLDQNGKQLSSTREYWLGKDNLNNAIKKRSNSQFSCFNMIKGDSEANSHWQNLARFQKINKNYRKILSLKLKKD